MVLEAHKMLEEKTGAGGEFLGWLDLPINYDKEEFIRIIAPHRKTEKIQIDMYLLYRNWS